MDRRKVVLYVADRYRAETPDGILSNVFAARDLAKRLWQRGAVVICPHLNSFLMDGVLPDGVWLKGYLEVLDRCDGVVLGPTWEQSEGARAEKAYAEAEGIPVFEGEDDPRLEAFLRYYGGLGVGHSNAGGTSPVDLVLATHRPRIRMRVPEDMLRDFDAMGLIANPEDLPWN